jgi:hypothetical protein
VSERLPTVQEREYRLSVKVLNAAAWLASVVGTDLCTLDEASILKAARRRTGHEDFGDETFREALRALLAAVEGQPLTSFAHFMLRQTWIQASANRLHYQAFIKRHAEVLEQKVERPVFVLGFPRTGTTLLQNLLSLDPSRRALEFWELTTPVPLIDGDRERDHRKRRTRVERQLKVAYIVAPEMGEVHYIAADTVEECWPLFANTFAVMNFDFQSGIGSIGDFLMNEHDMRVPYREYRDYLQLLLHERPAENLVLKCPEHLWFVDALLEVFPDACIVWTHRDPYAAVASYCSLISMQWRTLYGTFDPHETGRHIADRFLLGIERALDARSRHDPSRFYDVGFHQLVDDPTQVVKDICAHFELPYDAGNDDRIAHWLATEREDARGKHVYVGERYGLDRQDIHRRYASYIERFGIKVRKD